MISAIPSKMRAFSSLREATRIVLQHLLEPDAPLTTILIDDETSGIRPIRSAALDLPRVPERHGLGRAATNS